MNAPLLIMLTFASDNRLALDVLGQSTQGSLG
jgi:hypothetical protein